MQHLVDTASILSRWVYTALLGLSMTAPTFAQVTADFSGAPTSGCSPLVVKYTDLSSGPVAFRTWTFGNGNTSTLVNPAAVYVTPGLYDVSLMVTDGVAPDTRTRSAYIEVLANASADFAVDVTTGTAPLAVQFTDLSSAGEPITGRLWDFGDGNMSTATNPAHTYAGGGIYSVSLTVSLANGCSRTETKPALVNVNPVGNNLVIPVGTIPPGESRTITFDVVVNSDTDLPPIKSALSTQATVTSTNLGDVISDDPNDLGGQGAENATLTPLVPGYSLSGTALAVSEPAGTDSFVLSLNGAPAADVDFASILASNGQCQVSPASATLNAGNWDVGVTFTVTAIDEDIADGTQACPIVIAPAVSADPMFDGLNPPDVDVQVADDDAVGISVSPTSGLITTEAGGSDSFSVVLVSEPTMDVSIDLISSDLSEGSAGTATLVFTPADWDTAQTVTVTGANDDVDDGDVIYSVVTDPAVSGDPAYSGVDAVDVSVTNNDDGDLAGVTISPTSGLVTSEAGGTDSFDVVLNSEPVFDVSFGLSSSNSAEGVPSPLMLVFTSANWDIPQTVTVTGADDDVDDGDVGYFVSTSPAVSMDPNYDDLGDADVSVTNVDDDTAGISVAPLSGLITTEAGGTDTFTVVLDSEPLFEVSIPISSSDTGEATAAPASLSFTAANWDTPQTVTATGVDDAVVDADQAYTIVTGAAISTDPNYGGVDPVDVSATNTDDDSAGIGIDDVSVTEGTGGNTTATFTVTLDTAVDGGFTVDYSSSDGSAAAPADYSAAMGTLAFIGGAGETQTIAVTVVGDSVFEPDETYAVDLGAPTNAAVGVTDGSGLGTIVDDDSADLSVALSAAPDPVIAGTQLTYAANVSNAGPADAADVSVSLTIPVGASVVSSNVDGGGSCSGVGTLVCGFSGPVLAGTPRSVTVIVDVAPSVLMALSSTATVSTSTVDPNAVNDVSSVSTAVSTAADLSLIMTIVPATGTVGDFFVLSATATNGGPSDAQDLAINVDVPQGLVIINSNPSSGGVCSSAQPVGGVVLLSCGYAGPTIPGAEHSVEALLQASANGQVVISAGVSSATSDPVANNNSAAAAVGAAVQQIPGLSPAMLAMLALLLAALGTTAMRARA